MDQILIVEDDLEISGLIRLYLENEGLSSLAVTTAEEALEVWAADRPAVILLDLNLPRMDGFTFLQTLRGQGPEGAQVRVLIVSARESDEDKLEGLGLGADDFVTKPFSPRVLVARVKAQLRRLPQEPLQSRAFGPFVLDWENQSLTRDHKRVVLRRKEWELLAFLARSPEKPYRPEVLYKEVWGNDFGDITTVAVHILRLRKKMGDDVSTTYLKTAPGYGYLFSLGNGPRREGTT